MMWEKLKKDIYYSDGSLRDIYVLDTNEDDWSKWIFYINENYKVKFTYFDSEGNKILSEKIILEEVLEYWKNFEDSLDAEFLINNVIFKCYFFSDAEIENDISPKDVKDIEQHYSIVEYMKSVSKLLNKEIFLSPENYSEVSDKKYIIINNNEVLISSL